MQELERFVDILDMIYSPADLVFSILFFYATSFLRTPTVSIVLIFTIGKILTIMKKKSYEALKWLIYGWFMGYSIYSLGIFSNLLDLDTLDWSTLAFSILAPLSLIVVGKQIGSMEIKGHKIFIYYVIMVLYLLFGVLWAILYPTEVIFTFLFVYWFIALFLVSIINYVKGG